MTWLITSDLHLSDRPRDSYRFGLFPWLAKQQVKYDVQATFLLGDITDYKDRHSAALVNQLVDGLNILRRPIFILKGNHDFVDPSNPFFNFLNHIQSLYFITEPTKVCDGLHMIPHRASQAEMDAACAKIPPGGVVMAHQLIEGAISESGSRLSGLRWPLVGARAPKATYLGDIHRPQRLACGPVYVGSPYHVRFGDNFNPRVLLVKDRVETDLHFPAPRKWSFVIDGMEDLPWGETSPGDQVKLELVLAREVLCEWQDVKKHWISVCKEHGLEVHGFKLTTPPTILPERTSIDPKARTYDEILTGFGKAEALSGNIMQVGRELVK